MILCKFQISTNTFENKISITYNDAVEQKKYNDTLAGVT